MSTELEWTTSDGRPADREPQRNRRRNQRWVNAFLIACVVLVLAGGGIGLYIWRTQPSQEQLLKSVQLYLQAEQRAVSSNDDALFLSLQVDDPSWLATQFGLVQATAKNNNVRVIDAEQHGADVWAAIGWEEHGLPLQRLAFFRWHEGRLQHGPPDPAFWGAMTSREVDWGKLSLHRADREWADLLTTYVAEEIARLCEAGCPAGRLPLDLAIAGDYGLVAENGEVRVPSPRLVGLDGAGAPSALFWDQLQRRLKAHLLPAEVRFAVPDESVEVMRRLAADFSASQPSISVEIVPFSTLPDDPVALLQAVDGAYMMPTIGLITGGHVQDLTPFSLSDPDFAADDFYATILAGVHWQDRLWAMPQSARMNLVYYDEPSFAAATLSPKAYLAQLWQPPPALSAAPASTAPSEAGDWPLLDGGVDSLYAHAYEQRCQDVADRRCTEALSAPDLAAALTWYYAQVALEGNMPDVTAMTEKERASSALNWLSFPRHVLLWVDSPGFYEHYDQLIPVGVLAFSEASDAVVTPLQINAGVISRRSENPQAVWAWLQYLSHSRPVGTARSIPARRSVADEIGYWATLPAPLQDAMVAAFNGGRAVTIEEQGYFRWEMLAELISGNLDAMQAADTMTKQTWFQQGE